MKQIIIFIFSILYLSSLLAQDSALNKTEIKKIDSARFKPNQFSPRKATIRSAILPGWGQAYNKKYWKIPIVYAGLGITTYVFVDNLKTYNELRFAYNALSKITADPNDSEDWAKVDEKYKRLGPTQLQYYRNQFRQYIDYSALVFLALWGLNVVDATVDAHLKNFDIGKDLSFNVKFGYSQMARTNGVSLVLSW